MCVYLGLNKAHNTQICVLKKFTRYKTISPDKTHCHLNEERNSPIVDRPIQKWRRHYYSPANRFPACFRNKMYVGVKASNAVCKSPVKTFFLFPYLLTNFLNRRLVFTLYSVPLFCLFRPKFRANLGINLFCLPCSAPLDFHRVNTLTSHMNRQFFYHKACEYFC